MKPPSSTSAFVVGTGRCGSTLLSELLRDFSDILSLSEFFTVLGGAESLRLESMDGSDLWTLFSELPEESWELLSHASAIKEIIYVGPSRRESAPLNLVPLPHLTPHFLELYTRLREYTLAQPECHTAELYGRVFGWLQMEFGKNGWVERSGGSLEYIDRILRLWPLAKVIHIFRPGPACAVSMAAHPFFRVRVARLVARDPTLPIAKALRQDIELDRFGAYWSAMVARSKRSLVGLSSERLLNVSYLDLLERPVETFDEVLRFLGQRGLPIDRRALVEERIRISPRRWSEGLSPEICHRLERACRPGGAVMSALVGSAG